MELIYLFQWYPITNIQMKISIKPICDCLSTLHRPQTNDWLALNRLPCTPLLKCHQISRKWFAYDSTVYNTTEVSNIGYDACRSEMLLHYILLFCYLFVIILQNVGQKIVNYSFPSSWTLSECLLWRNTQLEIIQPLWPFIDITCTVNITEDVWQDNTSHIAVSILLLPKTALFTLISLNVQHLFLSRHNGHFECCCIFSR